MIGGQVGDGDIPKTKLVILEGSGEWSALYINGERKIHGDHYLIEEAIHTHFGVEKIQSDAWVRRDDQGRTVVAASLEHFQIWEEEDRAAAERIVQLRAEADALETSLKRKY